MIDDHSAIKRLACTPGQGESSESKSARAASSQGNRNSDTRGLSPTPPVHHRPHTCLTGWNTTTTSTTPYVLYCRASPYGSFSLFTSYTASPTLSIRLGPLPAPPAPLSTKPSVPIITLRPASPELPASTTIDHALTSEASPSLGRYTATSHLSNCSTVDRSASVHDPFLPAPSHVPGSSRTRSMSRLRFLGTHTTNILHWSVVGSSSIRVA